MVTAAYGDDEDVSGAHYNDGVAEEDQRREAQTEAESDTNDRTAMPQTPVNQQNRKPVIENECDGDEKPSFGMDNQFSSPSPLPTTTRTTAAKNQRNLRERLNHLLDRWPRTATIIQRQLMVSSLIVVTLLGGYVLSVVEGPYEVSKNDSFLRQVWFLNSIPIENTTSQLVGLPTACLERWYNEHLVESSVAKPQEAEAEADSGGGYGYTPTMIDLGSFAQDASFWIDANLTNVDLYQFVHALVEENNIDLPKVDLPPLASFPEPAVVVLPSVEDNKKDKPIPVNATIGTATWVVSTTNDTPSEPITLVPAKDVYEAMLACEQLAGDMLQTIIDFTLDLARYDFLLLLGIDGGPAGLTFNWNRCWNDTEMGSNSDPFRPSRRQIEASQYQNQTEYYTKRWNDDRRDLYRAYALELGCHDIPVGTTTTTTTTTGGSITNLNATIVAKDERIMCYWEATKRSVMDATGGGGCRTNTGSAGWFWFTIMTTVGYGNFSPETSTGRLLVWCFGWLSIIAFGGIMIVVGSTYAALVDDLFARKNLQWLKRPAYSAALWGLVSLVWIVLIASRARHFWNTNTPEFDYTLGDSYWFSYITVLTVGFGDFVLQPQGMFITDVFQWTALCLHGFVFISSFLGKVGDLLQTWIPQRTEPFEYHLARTDLCGRGYNTPISKSLEILKELVGEPKVQKAYPGGVEEYGSERNAEERTYRTSFVGNDRALAPDGNTINYHRMRILMEKRKLLIELLNDTQSELEDRVTRSLALDGGHGEDRRDLKDRVDIYALYQTDRSLTIVEELHNEERVLESALLQTKQLSTYFEGFQSESDPPKTEPPCEP